MKVIKFFYVMITVIAFVVLIWEKSPKLNKFYNLTKTEIKYQVIKKIG